MSKLRIGQLVYTKNVGFPYNRTDDGGESWEGVCCRVTKLKAGWHKDMVEVEAVIPVKTSHGRTMTSCLFWTENVKPEDRPWLRRHLKDILNLKKKLREVALLAGEISL